MAHWLVEKEVRFQPFYIHKVIFESTSEYTVSNSSLRDNTGSVPCHGVWLEEKKNNAGTTSRPPYTWGGNAMHFSYQAVKNFNKEAMKYLSISLIRYTLGREYFRQSCHIIVMWIHSLAFIQLIQQDLTVLVWQFREFRSLLSDDWLCSFNYEPFVKPWFFALIPLLIYSCRFVVMNKLLH